MASTVIPEMFKRATNIRGPAQTGNMYGVDAATFEDISGRLRGLLIGLEDRMTARDTTLISEFIDAGELGLALEQIADVLSEDEAPVSSTERQDMLGLVARMQMDDRVLGALRCCPDRP